MNIWGGSQRDLIEEVEDVARQNDGEQQKGGRPFASREVESCFHAAKIALRGGGCQEGERDFCEQKNVDCLGNRQQAKSNRR